MLVIVEKVESTAAPAMTETVTMSPIVAKSAKLLDTFTKMLWRTCLLKH